MLDTAAFGAELHRWGFDFYSGVPCSFLKSLINYAINHMDYVAAANEGDAVAIATGAYVGGRKAVVLMQNSGFTNAISPLTSLNSIFSLPVLGFVSLRGEPDLKDEPQHKLMGVITTTMLDVMGIEWEYLSSDIDMACLQIRRANRCIEEKRTFFFVVRKGTFSSEKLNPQLGYLTENKKLMGHIYPSPEQPSRSDILKVLVDTRTPETVLLATTGFTGRELYEINDLECNFYMVGSMGCVSSMGLGLALVQSKRPIVVIDGDGAALMRMGALATNGYYAPNNMLHILLNNGCHESTGAQFTVSSNVDWPAIASSCGYPHAYHVHDLRELYQRIHEWQTDQQLTFLSLSIRLGVPEGLSRPSVAPDEVAVRLMRYLGTSR